jgi:hydrogenase expression/formation protein HypC
MCLGVPGRIVAIADAQDQRAIAEVEGVRREISVALLGVATGDGEVVTAGEATGLEAVAVGDWVLIHVGFAMSRIDEAEAQETLRALKLFSGAFEEEMLEFGADGPLDPLDVLRPGPSPDAAAGEPR